MDVRRGTSPRAPKRLSWRRLEGHFLTFVIVHTRTIRPRFPGCHAPRTHGSLLAGSMRHVWAWSTGRVAARTRPRHDQAIIDAVLGEGLGPAIATFQEVTAKFAVIPITAAPGRTSPPVADMPVFGALSRTVCGVVRARGSVRVDGAGRRHVDGVQRRLRSVSQRTAGRNAESADALQKQAHGRWCDPGAPPFSWRWEAPPARHRR